MYPSRSTLTAPRLLYTREYLQRMASIAGSHITNRSYRLEIASLPVVHERTKTSNRLWREVEMTIAILEMPISIKLTFGRRGCSGLVCHHNRHCRLFIVPMRPVARLHTVRSRIQASNRAGLSLTEGFKHTVVYNFRHQSRLEWSRNPQSFRLPPWKGIRGDGGGCGSILDLSPSCVKAEPERQGYRCRPARRHTFNL